MVQTRFLQWIGKVGVLGFVLVTLTACPPQQGAEGGEAGGGDMLMSILPLILIFVVFYFLLIRPQQKKQKAHRAMLSNVNRGDDIVTNGGLVGHVVKVGRGESILVEIAPDIRVRVMRNMISQIMPRHDLEDDEDEDEDEVYEDETEGEEYEELEESEEPEEEEQEDEQEPRKR
jgi:preprotein translocase subunit YajC